ncbi:MAG: hypothetical protein EBU76_10550 [Gammaproteobacteria bacterium]|nr:hypothetical protein [Gammaproteobacteria bacterium]
MRERGVKKRGATMIYLRTIAARVLALLICLVAANAVAEMDRKLSEAKQMLAAVVLAVGGDVCVGQLDLIHSRDVIMTISDDPSNGGVRVKVIRT